MWGSLTYPYICLILFSTINYSVDAGDIEEEGEDGELVSGLVGREGGPGLLLLPLQGSVTQLDDARGKRVPEDVPVQDLHARELDKALVAEHFTRKTLKMKS